MGIPQQKTFEDKVSGLVAATRHLEIPKILMLRRLTLHDEQTLRWANERQLSVIFNVIISRAMQSLGVEHLREARKKKFQPLLPASSEHNEEDLRILQEVSLPILGAGNEDAESTLASFQAMLNQRIILPPLPPFPRQLPPLKDPPPYSPPKLGQRMLAASPLPLSKRPPRNKLNPNTNPPRSWISTHCSTAQSANIPAMS